VKRSQLVTKKRRKRQGDDPRYKRFIESLPCCAPGCEDGCQEPAVVVAHHKTGAGMATTAADREAMPLGWWCHQHFHDNTGPFKGWTKPQRRDWQNRQVALCLLAWDARQCF
jgi:hypothetical protein